MENGYFLNLDLEAFKVKEFQTRIFLNWPA